MTAFFTTWQTTHIRYFIEIGLISKGNATKLKE